VRIDVITIFPTYFDVLDLSLIGRARASGLVDVRVHDLRGFTDDPHRSVDDRPYGGGPGMVMRPEPWGRALDSVIDRAPPARLVVPTPSGRQFAQPLAVELAGEPWLVFACGRYEGIDARVVEDARRRMPVDELSIGDYVLAGGEAAALVVIEAVTRLLPGVVGNTESITDESFNAGNALEAPAYTRPPSWRGLPVPDVLLSGDHEQVRRWRRAQAAQRTAAVRPDLSEERPARDLAP
jgi:tRNA (guanine37-N1)-methyltransferase